MPITHSAKREVKKALKKQKRNYAMRNKYKKVVKDTLAAIKINEADKAKELLKKAYSVLDTAKKKHILHQNTVARKKSRLARLVGKIEKK